MIPITTSWTFSNSDSSSALLYDGYTNTTSGMVACYGNDATSLAVTAKYRTKLLNRATDSSWTGGDVWDYATTSTSTSGIWKAHIYRCGDFYAVKPTLSEKLRDMIRDQLAPAFISNDRRLAPGHANDLREQRARETLLRIIGADQFRRFLKYGFVSVRAKSGLTYQLFTGHKIACVFNNGILQERLCVVLRGEFPPTDSLIVRYLMVLNNEEGFRALAIKHSLSVRLATNREYRPNGVLNLFAEKNKRLVA